MIGLLQSSSKPVRDCVLRESGQMIRLGLLSQGQVDSALEIGYDKEKERNISMYGVANPSTQLMFKIGLEGLKDLNFNPNFVSMNEGRYSSGEELSTIAGGCNISALYFEKDGRSEGILTHYDPMSLTKNVDKLSDLRGKLMENPDLKKGVLITSITDNHFNSFKDLIGSYFPGIDLETVVYGRNELDANFSPAQGHLETNLFGRKNLRGVA